MKSTPFTFGHPSRAPTKADRADGYDPYNSCDARPNPVPDPVVRLDLAEIELRVAAALYNWETSSWLD